MTVIYSVGRTGKIIKMKSNLKQCDYIRILEKHNKKFVKKELLEGYPTKFALWFDSSKEWPAIVGIGTNK